VVEGRWIGDDAFAVVTQRTTDPSLATRIATGERFATTRVAAILREVNGLLEWAREHNITHRTITADRIYLEPKTDRVRASFGVAPIRRIQQTDGPTDDARAVVRLAMAMLTGSEDPGAYEGKTLAELRPDLPERLREATAEMLDEKGTHTAADVSAYLALVGMADPLYAGETEASRIRAEVLEEQRVEREKLAAERAEFERVMAEERAAFEKFMADEREQYERHMADEHAAFEQMKADQHTAFERQQEAERAKAANDKAALQRAVSAERAALVAKRSELERAIAEQRKELERVSAEDRRRIDALRAELKAAGELEIEKKREAALEEVSDAESTLDEEAFATPLFVAPSIIPLEALTFDDDTVLFQDTEEEPVVLAPVPAVEPATVGAGEQAVVAAGGVEARKRWMVPAAIAGLIVLVGASAIAVASRRGTPAPAVAAPAKAPVVAQAPVTAAPVSVVPLPAASTLDSSGGNVSRALDSAKAAAPVVKPKPKPKKIVRDTVAGDSTSLGDSLPLFRDASPRKRDTIVKKDSVARPDTAPRPNHAPR
jgi:hypothetical protein